MLNAILIIFFLNPFSLRLLFRQLWLCQPRSSSGKPLSGLVTLHKAQKTNQGRRRGYKILTVALFSHQVGETRLPDVKQSEDNTKPHIIKALIITKCESMQTDKGLGQPGEGRAFSWENLAKELPRMGQRGRKQKKEPASRCEGGNQSDGFKGQRGVCSPASLSVCRRECGNDGSSPFGGVTYPSERLMKATDVLSSETCISAPDFAGSLEVKKRVQSNGDTALRTTGLCQWPSLLPLAGHSSSGPDPKGAASCSSRLRNGPRSVSLSFLGQRSRTLSGGETK